WTSGWCAVAWPESVLFRGQGPGPVVDDVERVMSDPAFDYTPSWLDRALERITEFVGDLVSPSFGGAGGTFGGGVGGVVAWLFVVAALVAVVAVVVVAVRNRIRRPEVADQSTVDVEHRRPAAEWAADAERFEADGAWAEAVRARYRELVRRLVDTRSLPDVAGLTTTELRDELNRTTPSAAGDFDLASRVFEAAWYRLQPVGPSDLGALRDAAARVLQAPRVPSGGGAPVEPVGGARP
ncbi:MAG: DUF4129 domain-containing protein, partial [Microthrixaceae bacterium]